MAGTRSDMRTSIVSCSSVFCLQSVVPVSIRGLLHLRATRTDPDARAPAGKPRPSSALRARVDHARRKPPPTFARRRHAGEAGRLQALRLRVSEVARAAVTNAKKPRPALKSTYPETERRLSSLS